jgi:hypothetical protein
MTAQAKKPRTARQCKTCPWKVGADVALIPNYQRDQHEKLTCTIADGPYVPAAGILRAMACHYSTERKNKPCIGWIYNQLGPGNNIGVRLAVMTGRLPVPKIDGDQYETFEETLGKRARRSR